MRHKQLAERVSFLKENRGEVDKMSSSIIAEFFKDEIDEARTEGKEKNLIENIRHMMKKLNMTAQQAMDILEVPAKEQKKYLALI